MLIVGEISSHKTEGAACPACGKRGLDRWRAATPAAEPARDGAGYELDRCPSCGSAALRGPRLAPDLYEAGTYAPSRSWLDPVLEPLRRLVDLDRLRMLGRVGAGDRVLDVGAGRGRLVAALARRGADAVGIEPSPALWEAARAREAAVRNVSLEEAELPPGSRDLVICWHVLEHLDQPAEALARIRPGIAPGGRAVLAVPNLASLQARIGGDRWFHQDVPRHRTHFTPEGLERLLDRSGYRQVRSRRAIVDQGVLGMWLTLLNRLTVARDVPFRFIKRDLRYPRRVDALRDALVAILLGLPLALVAAALEAGATLAGRGGSIVVEARID